MNMAKNVARLISDSIRHPNGLPVECVIPETTIGRVAEAAKCAELFERGGSWPHHYRHSLLGLRL